MRSIDVLRGTYVLLGGGGAFLVQQGLGLRLYGPMGPGPGFFPVGVGALLLAFCLIALGQSLIAPAAADGPFFPTPEARRRWLTMVLAFALVWVGLKYLGFRLAVLVFALVVPRVFGRQSALATGAVAVLASFGVAYVFEERLRLMLPRAAFDVLADLGL